MQYALTAVTDYCLNPIYTTLRGLKRRLSDPLYIAREASRLDFILNTLSRRAISEDYAYVGVPFYPKAIMVIGDPVLAKAVFQELEKQPGSRSPFYDAFQGIAGDVPFILSASGAEGIKARNAVKQHIFPFSHEMHNVDLHQLDGRRERIHLVYERMFEHLDTALDNAVLNEASKGAVLDLPKIIMSAVIALGLEMSYGPNNTLHCDIETFIALLSDMDAAGKGMMTPADYEATKNSLARHARLFARKNINNLRGNDSYARDMAIKYLIDRGKMADDSGACLKEVDDDTLLDAFTKTNALMSLQAIANISGVIITAVVESIKHDASHPKKRKSTLQSVFDALQERSLVEEDDTGPARLSSKMRDAKPMDYLYVYGLFCESIRFNTRVPAIGRTCKKAIHVSGMSIQRGTMVLLPVYQYSHDPKRWHDPMVFDPERYMKKPWDIRGGFDFSVGPRHCPAGAQLAPKLFLAAMAAISRYHIQLDCEPPILMVDKRLYGQYPERIPVLVSKRRIHMRDEPVAAHSADGFRPRYRSKSKGIVSGEPGDSISCIGRSRLL